MVEHTLATIENTPESIFRVSYGGVALQSAVMDVRDLAPALMSLSDLITESNRVINAGKPELSLNIRATEKGSFEIELLVSGLYNTVVDLFSQKDVVAISVLLSLLGITAKDQISGLFQLLKKGRGKKPHKVIRLGKGGNVRFDFGDGEVIEVHSGTAQLYADVTVRKHTEGVVKPLYKEGIDSFKIIHSGKSTVEVAQSEVRYFGTPRVADELITDFTAEKVFSIISLAFKEDNKWRLSDGAQTYPVTIRDENFIKRIERNIEQFAMGSLLRVELRTLQYKTDVGLKTEYEVLRVVEHIVPDKQLDLPFENEFLPPAPGES